MSYASPWDMDFFEQQERLYLGEIQQFPWMKDCEMNLGTAENIAEAIDACIASGMYSYDCETTGLDRRLVDGVTRDKIVGFSISPDGRRSWYFPMRHQDTDANVPILLAEKHLRRLFASSSKALFFNANFDQEFAEFGSSEPLGTFEDTTKWEDGHLLSYLENSRRNSHGLKELSKVDLGCEMIELESLFPPDYKGKLDFSKLDPTSPPVIWYGCSDAIMHYRIFKEKERTVLACPRPQTVVYQIEKLCLLSVRWMQRNRVHVDREIVKELLTDGKEEFRSALLEVYNFCCDALDRDIAPGYIRIWLNWPGPGQDFRSLGTPAPAPGEPGSEGDEEMEEDLKEEFREAMIQSKWLGLDKVDKNKKFRQIVNASGKTVPEKYDIFSAQQLGLLLEELGIPGLVRTEKSGQIDTGDEELERLSKAHGDKYPFLGKLRRFRSLDKAFGTYLLALWKDTWDFDSTLNVQFKQAGTDTGRFKTPGPRDKNYREWGGTKYPLHGTPSPADDSKPNCLRYVRRVFTPRKVPRQTRILAACFAKGSLVSTARGLIPIEDVRAGDFVLTDQGYDAVFWAGKTGTKPTVEIKTSKGFTLRVTKEHKIRVATLTGFDWKTAGELRPGDWIVQVEGTPLPPPPPATLPPIPWSSNSRALVQEKKSPCAAPTHMTPLLAEILGRFMGDGSISHTRGDQASVNFALGSDVEEVFPTFNRDFQSLFGKDLKRRPRGDVTVSSRPLARWFDLVTEKTRDCHQLTVPPSILQGSEEVITSFLRGFFDADGSSGVRAGDGVSAWISSAQMSKEIQILLLHLGIQAKRAQFSRHSYAGHSQGWLLTVTGIENLRRFASKIHMACERKRARLNQLIAAGRNRDISNFIPHSLAKLAVRKQRHPETNRIHTNGKRKGRVSKELLRAALKHPPDLNREWMDLLLEGPLFFDTVESIADAGVCDVYDVNVPRSSRLQVDGILAHNCDLSGVELRIVTNISGEPLWLDEYFRCSTCELTFDRGDGKSTPAAPPNFCPRCGSDRIGDLHTLSGIAFFGEEATKKDNWKQLRGWAKQVNFALCYGGSGKTVQDGIGCDEAEGARIHHKFNSTYKGLAAWWESIVQFGQTHGYVCSAFGRKYSVEDLNLPITPDKEPNPQKREMNKKFRAKAKRNAINGPIQSTSADIIKIAMGRIYKEVFKRGWQDLMCMTITMHDELVFEIDLSILAEALPMIQHEMTRCKAILGLKWRVPLLSDMEIGLDWTVPWDFKDLVYGRVRPDGVVIDEKGQPIKESKKARWPDWLLAAFPESKFPRAGQASGKPTESVSQETVEFTLPAMDEQTIQWLAGVIFETAYPGKGALLKLRAPMTGEVIPLLEELRVDPEMFRKAVAQGRKN